MMRTKAILAAAAAIVLAACGQPPAGTAAPQPAPGAFRTAVAAQFQVDVLDARGRRLASLPAGVLAPDWSSLYSMAAGGTLAALDPAGGAARWRLAVPSGYQLPGSALLGLPDGLSHDGRWLVLQRLEPPPAQGQPTSSAFAVVDLQLRTVARKISLPGWFEYDAISDDGQRLYLREQVPGPQGGGSRVRLYRLDTSGPQPGPVAVRGGPEVMTGVAQGGEVSRDGAWRYGLVVGGDGGAYLDALSLNGPADWLVALPGGAAAGFSFLESMAQSTDGRLLFVVDPESGWAETVDVSRLSASVPPRIVRRARVPVARDTAGLLWSDAEAKQLAAGAAALSPDGGRLYAFEDTGVLVLDTRDLSVRGRLAAGFRLQSLGLSPDGTWLVGLTEDSRLVTIDTRTGSPAQTLQLADPQAILGVRGPAPARG